MTEKFAFEQNTKIPPTTDDLEVIKENSGLLLEDAIENYNNNKNTESERPTGDDFTETLSK